MPLPVHEQPLPYVSQLPLRAVTLIRRVVIHCTELPDLSTARTYGERAHYDDGTGHSGHYYINRDGNCYCYVPGTRIAYHARGYNTDSIGVELVNRGRYPNWFDSRQQRMTEPYTNVQIASLCAWLQQWREEFPELRYISGHEDLDTERVQASDDPSQQVLRKCDPGALFPWDTVLASCQLERFPRGEPNIDPNRS